MSYASSYLPTSANAISTDIWKTCVVERLEPNLIKGPPPLRMAAPKPHVQSAPSKTPSSATQSGNSSGTRCTWTPMSNPISHVFGIDQQQLSDRLAKYKPIDARASMRPAPCNHSQADAGRPTSGTYLDSRNKILEGERLGAWNVKGGETDAC